MNVFDNSSYQRISYQCEKADIVVFNYLFSENKTSLDEAKQALDRLAQITPHGCKFVVIDRLEYTFRNEVVDIFKSVFDVEIDCQELGGTLDTDEQTSEMGEMLTSTLKRTPRVKFFNSQSYSPTVFWFVVKKE